MCGVGRGAEEWRGRGGRGQEATRERRRSPVDYFTRRRIDFLSIITAHRASVKVVNERKERNGRCEKEPRPRRAKGEPTVEREAVLGPSVN